MVQMVGSAAQAAWRWANPQNSAGISHASTSTPTAPSAQVTILFVLVCGVIRETLWKCGPALIQCGQFSHQDRVSATGERCDRLAAGMSLIQRWKPIVRYHECIWHLWILGQCCMCHRSDATSMDVSYGGDDLVLRPLAGHESGQISSFTEVL